MLKATYWVTHQCKNGIYRD